MHTLRPRALSFSFLFAVTSLVGCGGDSAPGNDASTHDAAMHDASMHDAANHDASLSDAATNDAAMNDAAPVDSSTPDANADPCANVACENAGTCVNGSCECVAGTNGPRCQYAGCDSDPCFPGVTCTDHPESVPNFMCGECPRWHTGNGVMCTPDVIDPPSVVSTNPAQGASIRFDASAFNAGEINRVVVTFDRDVYEVTVAGVPITATANHLTSDFSQAFVVQPRVGPPDNTVLTFVADGTPYSSFPGGSYEFTIENIRSVAGGLLDTYTWGFSATACGDGTCDVDETSCSCASDCGACTGCCNQTEQCLPGTANNACGQGGASCGVCLSPDVCVNGAGCA